MFTPKMDTYVDKEINRAVLVLGEQEPNSEEYASTLEHLAKLQKIRQEEKPDRISYDTMLMVGAHLAGMLLIIRHENVNVITSKALSFIPRLR
jgi:hypothetical protein